MAFLPRNCLDSPDLGNLGPDLTYSHLFGELPLLTFEVLHEITYTSQIWVFILPKRSLTFGNSKIKLALILMLSLSSDRFSFLRQVV